MYKKCKKILDITLEAIVTIAMTILVLDVVWQVFTRHVLKDPCSWSEELAIFLMVWVGLLGSSVALNRGAHLGIDYFTAKLSLKKRQYTELFVFFCIAVFSTLTLIFGGSYLVIRTLYLEQISPALNLKVGYVYLVLPISGFFLALYSTEFFIEILIAILKGKRFKEPHDFESSVAMD